MNRRAFLAMPRYHLSRWLRHLAGLARPQERSVWHGSPSLSQQKINAGQKIRHWMKVGSDGVLEHHTEWPRES